MYYNYRYYKPAQGKWLSRDPIAERGGLNIYGFVGNDGINQSDYLGYTSVKLIFGAFIPKSLGTPVSGAPHPDKNWFGNPDPLADAIGILNGSSMVSTDNRSKAGMINGSYRLRSTSALIDAKDIGDLEKKKKYI